MPDDPATTATLEEEVKEPPIAADFEAAETPPPEVKPDASIEIEEPPEKSATERLFDSIIGPKTTRLGAGLKSFQFLHNDRCWVQWAQTFRWKYFPPRYTSNTGRCSEWDWWRS